MIRSCSLKPQQICESLCKANDFFAGLSSFELGRIKKHLMTGPGKEGGGGGGVTVTSMFPEAKPIK